MRHRRMVVLAVAVRADRLGYVLLIDGQPRDWRISRKACLSPKAARAATDNWIKRFEPTVIVLEAHGKARRKSQKTRSIIRSVRRSARRSSALVSVVERRQHHPNKFSEAAALVDRFPEMSSVVLKRPKLWQREPRNLVYFEALALAVQSGFIEAE